MGDKIITNVESLSSADITNAEFYIELNNDFVKIPFSLIQEKLQQNNTISDTSTATDKTLSASKIYDLLDEKSDIGSTVTFAMLDSNAKAELLEYIKQNTPIDYNITGDFIDDTTESNATTYSSQQIESRLEDLADIGLKADSVLGTHISDDAMSYIVNWIKDNGIVFENVPATGFRFSNIPLSDAEDLDSGYLVLFPYDVPFTIAAIYTPSNATSGKQLVHSLGNTNISIDENSAITVNTYDSGETTVTSSLIDDNTAKHTFTVKATKTVYTADLTGDAGASVAAAIASTNNSGYKLACPSGCAYSASGNGIALLNNALTVDNIKVNENAKIKITIKLQDISSNMEGLISSGGQHLIECDFGNSSFFYAIQNLTNYQSRYDFYVGSQRISQQYGAFLSNSATDEENPGEIGKSAIHEITVDIANGEAKWKTTGYFDNNFTTKTTNYNSVTVTLKNDDYTTDDKFGNGIFSLKINPALIFDATLSDVKIEYI